ncbi:unnamed protein product [Rotaria sp. Silwood1]|nr:unnamed protein product [Rotaria sp. Silwood1]CAF4712890.1 unnamed protein product [Rotaria sp. Silwood1]
MSIIDWQTLFDDVFDGYPDKWTLTYVHRNDKHNNRKFKNQRLFERTGYAKFHCSKCSNGWASAKAKVILYYPNANESLGTVNLRFFGQQCKKCVGNKSNFADPEFDDDWIKSTLEKLYERIGWNCYGIQRPPKTVNNKRKLNKIEGPHETALCEACQLGCCDQTTIKKKY